MFKIYRFLLDEKHEREEQKETRLHEPGLCRRQTASPRREQVELTCNPLAVEPSRSQLPVVCLLSLHPLDALASHQSAYVVVLPLLMGVFGFWNASVTFQDIGSIFANILGFYQHFRL
jgi:hypothetical protein